MRNLPDKYWRKILDFLAEAGNQPDLPTFTRKVIERIQDLVPYDSSFVFFLDQNGNITPDSFTIETPAKAAAEYAQYYLGIDPCSAHFSPEQPLTYADWRTSSYQTTEFYEDFIRPLHYTSSVGIMIPDSENRLALSIGGNREGQVLSEMELTILSVIQPHLRNFYTLYQRIAGTNPQGVPPMELPRNPEKAKLAASVPDLGSKRLTKRENEIVNLLCQGLSTQQIRTLLFISEFTVYRHTNNIFGKMNVSSRTELVAKVLGNSRS